MDYLSEDNPTRQRLQRAWHAAIDECDDHLSELGLDPDDAAVWCANRFPDTATGAHGANMMLEAMAIGALLERARAGGHR